MIAITQGVRKITVQYAKRVVGPQNVRRTDAVYAFESELRGRDADHLRLGAAPLSSDDCRLRISKQSDCAKIASALSTGWPHYVVLAGDDFLLQLFLGRDAVSTSRRSRTT